MMTQSLSPIPIRIQTRILNYIFSGEKRRYSVMTIGTVTFPLNLYPSPSETTRE